MDRLKGAKAVSTYGLAMGLGRKRRETLMCNQLILPEWELLGAYAAAFLARKPFGNKTEIVLEVEVANANNENGYLKALGWRAIPQSTKDRAIQHDFSLWALANPAMGG